MSIGYEDDCFSFSFSNKFIHSFKSVGVFKVGYSSVFCIDGACCYLQKFSHADSCVNRINLLAIVQGVVLVPHLLVDLLLVWRHLDLAGGVHRLRYVGTVIQGDPNRRLQGFVDRVECILPGSPRELTDLIHGLVLERLEVLGHVLGRDQLGLTERIGRSLDHWCSGHAVDILYRVGQLLEGSPSPGPGVPVR